MTDLVSDQLAREVLGGQDGTITSDQFVREILGAAITAIVCDQVVRELLVLRAAVVNRRPQVLIIAG